MAILLENIEGEGSPQGTIHSSIGSKYTDLLTNKVYECIGTTEWKLIVDDEIPLESRVVGTFSQIETLTDLKIGEKIFVGDRGVEFEVIKEKSDAIKAYSLGTYTECASYRYVGSPTTINIGDKLIIGVYMDSAEQLTSYAAQLFSFDDSITKGRFNFRSYPRMGTEFQVYSGDNALWNVTKIETYEGDDITNFYDSNALPINRWYRVTFTSLITFSYSSIRLFNFVFSDQSLYVNYLKVGNIEFLIDNITGESIFDTTGTIELTNVNSGVSPTIIGEGDNVDNYTVLNINDFILEMKIKRNVLSPEMFGYVAGLTKSYTNPDIVPYLQKCVDLGYDIEVSSGNHNWQTELNINKPVSITFKGAVLHDIQNFSGNSSEREFDYNLNKSSCVLYTNVVGINMININSSDVILNKGNFDLSDIEYGNSSAVRFDCTYRLQNIKINDINVEGNISTLSIGELDPNFVSDNGSYGVWFDTENATADGGYLFNCYVTGQGCYLRNGIRLKNYRDNPILSSSYFNNGLTLNFNGDGCARIYNIENLNNSIINSYSQDRAVFNYTDSVDYPFYLNVSTSVVDVFLYDSAWGASYTITQVDTYANLSSLTPNTTNHYYVRDEGVSYKWNGSTFYVYTKGYTHYYKNIYNPSFGNILDGRAASIYDSRTRQLNTDLGRYDCVTKKINDIIYNQSIIKLLNNSIHYAALEGDLTYGVYSYTDESWITNGTNLYPADDAVNNPDGSLPPTTPTAINLTGLLIGNADGNLTKKTFTLAANQVLEIIIPNRAKSDLVRFFAHTSNTNIKSSLVINGSDGRKHYTSTNGQLVSSTVFGSNSEYILRLYGSTNNTTIYDIIAVNAENENLSVLSRNGGNVYGNVTVSGLFGDNHAPIDIGDNTTYVELTTSTNYVITKRTIFLKNTSGSAITLGFNSSSNFNTRGAFILIQLTSDSDDIIIDTTSAYYKMISLNSTTRTLSGGDWILCKMQSTEAYIDRVFPVEIANSLPIDTIGADSTILTLEGKTLTVTDGLIKTVSAGSALGGTFVLPLLDGSVGITNSYGLVTAVKTFYPFGTPASPFPNEGSTVTTGSGTSQWFATGVTFTEDTVDFNNGTSSFKIVGSSVSFCNVRWRCPSVAGKTFTITFDAKSNTGEGRLRTMNNLTESSTYVSGTAWASYSHTTNVTTTDDYFDLVFYPKNGSGDATGYNLNIDNLKITINI